MFEEPSKASISSAILIYLDLCDQVVTQYHDGLIQRDEASKRLAGHLATLGTVLTSRYRRHLDFAQTTQSESAREAAALQRARHRKNELQGGTGEDPAGSPVP